MERDDDGPGRARWTGAACGQELPGRGLPLVGRLDGDRAEPLPVGEAGARLWRAAVLDHARPITLTPTPTLTLALTLTLTLTLPLTLTRYSITHAREAEGLSAALLHEIDLLQVSSK